MGSVDSKESLSKLIKGQKCSNHCFYIALVGIKRLCSVLTGNLRCIILQLVLDGFKLVYVSTNLASPDLIYFV